MLWNSSRRLRRLKMKWSRTKNIKEIFETLNYRATKIDRVFFGGLTKKNLPRKHYRHLEQKEINILLRL